MTDASSVVHDDDDDASVRTAVARLLRASGYEVALHESATELLEKPFGAERGCILLDVRMPALSGLQLQERLALAGSTLPIVFLTGHGDIPMSERAIKAGAEDFLSKPVSKATLLGAVQRALAHWDERRELNARLGAMRALVATLTPRETEVFAMVVRGNLNKQIAHKLGTSERTIKAHRKRIMEKLRVRSLAELVSVAERLGLLAAPRGGNSS